MTVKKALQAALASFGPNGEKWGQGNELGELPADKLCALTAATAVVKKSRYRKFYLCAKFVEMRTALRGALLVRGAGCEVVDFNDDPKTTFADIKALYERAIKAA